MTKRALGITVTGMSAKFTVVPVLATHLLIYVQCDTSIIIVEEEEVMKKRDYIHIVPCNVQVQTLRVEKVPHQSCRRGEAA